MSIYVSTLAFDAADHKDGCDRLVQLDPSEPPPGYVIVADNGHWTVDEAKPCTCHAGPLAYQQSHVLPADDDPRAGSIHLAEIPGYISREPDRVLCGSDLDCDKSATQCCDRVWPWLRACINAETVVLDRAQVRQIYHYLGDWLIRSED